jgi:nucleoside-diphosphate-sugar epimerase
MNIFITGATGYIGSAVAALLRSSGHEVAGLVRPDADTKALRDLGVMLIAGDLDALPSLREQLGEYDVFVHAAQSRQNTVALDRGAIDTFLSLPGHLLYTSGVWVMGNTDSADEDTPPNPLSLVAWRAGHERLVLDGGGAVLRPGCVYGGKQSLAADWFAAAEQKRATQLVGDGTNRWAMVDLHDLADLYARAVQQKSTGVLHGIDDTSATLAECVNVVGAQAEYVPLEQARESKGPFADALAVDQRIASSKTRERVGWRPRRSFLNALEEQWQEWRAVQR